METGRLRHGAGWLAAILSESRRSPTVGAGGACASRGYGSGGHGGCAGGRGGARRARPAAGPTSASPTTPAPPAPPGQPIPGSSYVAFSVAFSPDGHTLAAGSDKVSDPVLLWDLTDRTHPTPLGQPLTVPTGPVYNVDSVVFSPDGRTLAAGSDHDAVRLWDLTNRTHPTPLSQPLTGPTRAVSSVAFSPDGHTVAAGSDQFSGNNVWLWRIP
ncbi:MAG: WD40 repeat domain-containing protein [Frankia sp.]